MTADPPSSATCTDGETRGTGATDGAVAQSLCRSGVVENDGNSVRGDTSGHTFDLRLAPGALAVWAVTLLGLYAGWLPAALFLIPASVGVVLGWCSRAGVGGRVLLGTSLLVLVAATGIAVRGYQVDHHPLRTVAEHGGTATVRAELTDAPRQLSGDSYGTHRSGERSLVPAKLDAARVDGQRVSIGGRVLLLVPTAGWRSLVAGQEVVLRGKLAPPRAGELTVAAVSGFDPPERVGPAPRVQRIAEGLRAGLRNTSAAVLGSAAAGLLPGLVIGDTGGLPPEVERDFETAGLTHLTAVSGANLAIVCGAVLGLLRLVGFGPVVGALAATGALLGFVVLCGPEPSVLRAAAMGLITLLALVLGRERSTLPVLATSVLVLVLFAPNLASNIGFALSVAATVGLVTLAPVWSAALRSRGVPAGIAEALTVPLAAQVTTAPLLATISGEVSLVGVVANLLAGPVVAPATVLGVLATVTAPVATWFAMACVWLAAPELEWVLGIAGRAAAVPMARLSWPAGVFGGLALAVVLAFVLFAARARRVRWALLVVTVLLAAAVPVRGLVSSWPPRDWSAVMCDVGQGDALLLATGRPGEAVLVDTGPDAGYVLDCLRGLGITRVPLVLLSHFHADHIGGLRGVLAEHDVGGVAIGPMREPAWAKREISASTHRNSVPLLALRAGQRVRWPGLRVDVLGPQGSLVDSTDESAANDASVVLRARTPAASVLLTGDVELAGQQQLLWSPARLEADVLKVPHHGSQYTSPRFIAAVDPRIALISAGAGNDYGHPHARLLGMLANVPEVRRTDRGGDVAVLSDQRVPRTVTRGGPARATS